MNKLILLFLVISFSLSTISPSRRYVSQSSGNDSSSCLDYRDPCLTLSYVIDQLNPSIVEVIEFIDGVFEIKESVIIESRVSMKKVSDGDERVEFNFIDASMQLKWNESVIQGPIKFSGQIDGVDFMVNKMYMVDNVGNDLKVNKVFDVNVIDNCEFKRIFCTDSIDYLFENTKQVVSSKFDNIICKSVFNHDKDLISVQKSTFDNSKMIFTDLIGGNVLSIKDSDFNFNLGLFNTKEKSVHNSVNVLLKNVNFQLSSKDFLFQASLSNITFIDSNIYYTSSIYRNQIELFSSDCLFKGVSFHGGHKTIKDKSIISVKDSTSFKTNQNIKFLQTHFQNFKDHSTTEGALLRVDTKSKTVVNMDVSNIFNVKGSPPVFYIKKPSSLNLESLELIDISKDVPFFKCTPEFGVFIKIDEQCFPNVRKNILCHRSKTCQFIGKGVENIVCPDNDTPIALALIIGITSIIIIIILVTLIGVCIFYSFYKEKKLKRSYTRISPWS